MTLELTIEELNIVTAGLGKLPLEVSINTFAKIKAQAEKQFAEMDKPVEIVETE